MALATILIGLATVAFCLYLYFTRTFNYWRARNISGPTPVPFFGNLMESATRRKHTVFVMKKIYEDFSNEKLVGIFRMTTPSLLIRDPDIIKQVMIKDFDNFADRGVQFNKDGLGTNLLHSDEKTWRVLRNKFTPLFTSGKIKNMFYLINEKGDNFIKHIENIIQKQPEQEMYELVQTYTIATIASCAFGLDLDITEQSDTMDAMKKINQSMLVFTYGNEVEMMYPGILYKIGASVFTKDVTDFFYGLIRQITDIRKGKPTDRKDFMDLMLELKQAKEVQGSKKFEDDEAKSIEITEGIMAGQAFVFYAAGYEGSATTMTYVLYHLALNPDIQERVFEEIKEVLKQHGCIISYDAIKDLVYMDRVVHETLRMHPQGDPLVRGVTVDYTIPGTDITLKKGQTVLVSMHGLNYDEKYWSNPYKFDPDRFTPENSASRHPAVYLPFGIGPRKCIGSQFSKIQLHVFLVKLLLGFRLEATERTHDQLQFDPFRVSVMPVNGITMKVIPRESS